MTAIPNARYERKFVPAVLSLDAVLHAMRSHPALFSQAFPPRTVNNLYFDTPGFSDYREHVSGSAERAKVRVRWYGELLGTVAPVLERKIRRGLLGGKEGYRLPTACLDASSGLRGIQLSLRGAELPGRVREHVDSRAPALVNRYDRRYFVSADGRFRLTLDSHLRYGSPMWCGPSRLRAERSGEARRSPGAKAAGPRVASLPAALDSPGVVIVELKYAPEDADEASAVANRLPFFAHRFSKYVTGIDRVYGRG